jgi:hypothetical protein
LAVTRQDPLDKSCLQLLHLERVRDMLYPDVADWATDKLSKLDYYGPHDLVVDATGVGPAVTDLYKQRGIPFKGVKITMGEYEKYSEGYYRVPKRNIVDNLRVMMFEGRLKFANRNKMRHADQLVKELINFRLKILTKSAHDSFEAWRESDFDDLVLAVALAAWASKRFGGGVNSSLARNDGPFGPTDPPFEFSDNPFDIAI